MSSELAQVLAFLLHAATSFLKTVDWFNAALALLALSANTLLMLTLRSNKNFPEGFQRYCSTSFSRPDNTPNLSTDYFIELLSKDFGTSGPKYYIDKSKITHAGIVFSAAATAAAQMGKSPDLEIGTVSLPVDLDVDNIKTESFDSIENNGKKVSIKFPHFLSIKIASSKKSNHSAPIIIRGARILSLEIDSDYSGDIYLERCWIASVTFNNASATPKIEVNFVDCWIGNLNLSENCCSTLHLRGGGLTAITCASTTSKPPITQSIVISQDVVLHKDSFMTEAEISNYRNLCTHIKNFSSQHTQQLANAATFSLERKYEKGFLKFSSYFYQIFSNYNTKPGLPLLWMLSSFLTLAYLTYFLDQIPPPKGCHIDQNFLQGWMKCLCDPSSSGKLQRSLGFTFNNYISPLSTLAENTLLKSSSLYYQLVGITFGLLNLVWATLAIFSIKTRFSGKSSG